MRKMSDTLVIMFPRILLTVACATMGLSARAASSGSKSSGKSNNVLFEVSGGTSQLDQNMATEHLEHPPAALISGRLQKSIFHIGVSYLGLLHKDSTGASPAGQAPNPNELDAEEDFSLTTFCAGVLLGNTLLLDAGYGYATFKRTETSPNVATASSTSYNANGLGWMVGGSIIPIHFAGDKVSIGATGYYFDATASDYSSDVINGSTETIKSSGNGSVHSFGWYAGLSIFIGL